MLNYKNQSRPLRIGIDGRMYRSEVAGISRYSQNLVKNLLAIDEKNQYILFMTPDDRKEFQKLSIKNSELNNLKIVIVNIPHYSIAEQTKFAKIIDKENLDLMHFLNFNYPVNYKGKFITTIHDLTLIFFPETAKKTNLMKKLAFRYVMKKSCQNAIKIITDSENTKQDIIKYLKISNTKIVVTYLAADDKMFSRRSKTIVNHLKQKYQIEISLIITVGQFRPHKNLPGLLQAFSILREKIDCKLVIVGTPDHTYEQFWQILKKSKYKKDIIITGFVSDEELAGWYQLATVYVFPSFYEGFGLPGLEAMQAGLPVIASKASSLPEIYNDAAIYFNPLKTEEMAAKIKMVIEDKNLRAKLIAKGRAIAQFYSWRKTALETLKTYKEVIQE